MTETPIYEGKAKKLFRTDRPGVFRVLFKNSLTAFDGTKRDEVERKGDLNCAISTLLFGFLESKGIRTHFLEKIGSNEMLVRELEMLPVEVVVRNIYAGSLAKRLGKEDGEAIGQPVVEYYLKDDSLHDPWINEDHIAAMGLASRKKMASARERGLEINRLLTDFFKEKGLILVDFKLEFGRLKSGETTELILGDEVTPDTCRLWDEKTKERLDKDRFRRDLGPLLEGYETILQKIGEGTV